jgi:hypothetical protein
MSASSNTRKRAASEGLQTQPSATKLKVEPEQETRFVTNDGVYYPPIPADVCPASQRIFRDEYLVERILLMTQAPPKLCYLGADVQTALEWNNARILFGLQRVSKTFQSVINSTKFRVKMGLEATSAADLRVLAFGNDFDDTHLSKFFTFAGRRIFDHPDLFTDKYESRDKRHPVASFRVFDAGTGYDAQGGRVYLLHVWYNDEDPCDLPALESHMKASNPSWRRILLANVPKVRVQIVLEIDPTYEEVFSDDTTFETRGEAAEWMVAVTNERCEQQRKIQAAKQATGLASLD